METAQHKIVNRPTTVQPAAAVMVAGRNAVASTLPIHRQGFTRASSLYAPEEKEADATAGKIVRITLPGITLALAGTGRAGAPSRKRKEEQEEKEGKEEEPQTKLRSPYIARFANSGILAERNREIVLRKAEGQRNAAAQVSAEPVAASSASETSPPVQPAGNIAAFRPSMAGNEQKAPAGVASPAFDASRIATGQTRQNDGDSSTLLGRIAAAPKSPIQAEGLAQAQWINDDCARSELQVSGIAATRRQQISIYFSDARQGLSDFFTRSVLAVQTFIAGKQAEILAAVTRTFAWIRTAITGTLQAAQAVAGQIRARINQRLETISTSVQSIVESIAGQITGLIDSIPLPDIPGIARIRAAGVGLLNRAAGVVNGAFSRLVDFIGWAFNAGMNLLDSFLGTITRMVDMALSLASLAILSGMQMIAQALNRAVAFIGTTLRGVLLAVLIPILNGIESLITRLIGSAEQRALGLLRTNRNEYLSSLAEAVTPSAAAQGSKAVSTESQIAVIRQLGRDATQNSRLIVQTFEFIMGGATTMIVRTLASAAARIFAAIAGLIAQTTQVIVTAITRAIQILSQLMQAIGNFLRELIRELTEAVENLAESVRSLVQGGADQLIQFARNGLRRIGSFIRRFVQNLILGRSVSDSLTDALGEFSLRRSFIPLRGPAPPPPGVIVAIIIAGLTFLVGLIGGTVIVVGGTVMIIIGSTVITTTVTVVVIVAVVVLLLLLLFAYLLYRWLRRPKLPKPPPCPLPINVRNGPFHRPINEPSAVGMEIAITLSSSTGRDPDMATIQDSEQVSLSSNHAGSFVGLPPLPSSTSGFMPGFPIPNDRHTTPRFMIIDRADNHGGSGSFEKHQLDIFKAPACGVSTPQTIPASGYLIKRLIVAGPGTRIVFRTEKSPVSCTVNGFSTTAGPSPRQGDDVVVRR
jgi:hypothetical protein